MNNRVCQIDIHIYFCNLCQNGDEFINASEKENILLNTILLYSYIFIRYIYYIYLLCKEEMKDQEKKKIY